MARKSIGELNGLWAFLMKLWLSLCPVFLVSFIAFGTWVTSSIYKANTERALNAFKIEQIRSEHALHVLPPPNFPIDAKRES